MTTVGIGFDTSEIDNLQKLLSNAVARVPKERVTGLDRAAEAVRSQAIEAARGYTKGTGALADDIEVRGTPLTKRVGSDLREAFFLEFGSPNTGAPRPFLTGPARIEITKLLVELGHTAGPF